LKPNCHQVYYLKIEVPPLDSPWELSNPEKGPNSEECDPAYQKAGYGPVSHPSP